MRIETSFSNDAAVAPVFDPTSVCKYVDRSQSMISQSVDMRFGAFILSRFGRARCQRSSSCWRRLYYRPTEAASHPPTAMTTSVTDRAHSLPTQLKQVLYKYPTSSPCPSRPPCSTFRPYTSLALPPCPNNTITTFNPPNPLSSCPALPFPTAYISFAPHAAKPTTSISSVGPTPAITTQTPMMMTTVARGR